VMLTSSSYSENKDTHTKRIDVTNEVTGAGYTPGGAVSKVTVAKDPTNDRVDIALGPVSWPNATITARKAVYYVSRGGAASADELIAVTDFGTDVVATGGPFSLDTTVLVLRNEGDPPPQLPPNSRDDLKTSTAPSAGTAPTFISSDLDEGSSVKAVSIPAADRFVTRADNAPLFEDADKKLQAVIDAIPADNELRVSAEDRLLLIREVKDVQSLIKQPRVQLRAIYHATRESSILVWLAKEAGSGAVRALAAAAVTALLALLFL
jgi:hypothetical protein